MTVPGDGGTADPDGDAEPEADADAASLPFDGVALRLAGATASVAPERLGPLLRRAQADLTPRLDDYRRAYEAVADGDGRVAFLVPTGHWADVGERLGFGDREADAVRRVHEAQLGRIGRGTDRREEFDAALEIREAAVVAVPGTGSADAGDAAGDAADAGGDAGG